MLEQKIIPWENLQCGQQRKCNLDPDSHSWWVHLEDGRYCFRIDFASTVKMDLKSVCFAGGYVELKHLEQKSTFLLFLNENCDLEIFTKFCNVLLCIPEQQTCQDYADSILRVLRQWMRFLQKVNSKEMDIRKQIGLMGELLFLNNELNQKNGISFKELLKYWTGPDKAPNDFMIDNNSYEIKSKFNTEEIISISNEQQLLYTGKPLFLVVYSFKQEDTGIDLKDIIEEIEDNIINEDKSLIEEFEEKLFFAGFNPAEKYSGLLKFATEDFVIYKVNEDFPHVIKRGFESSISSIKYDLNLKSLNKFIIH